VIKDNNKNKVTDVSHPEKKGKQKDHANITLFKRFEKNYMEYSTIGGLSELGKRKDLYLRIFWMIVVFICSSYTLVTCIETVILFHNYEVNLVFGKYQEIPTKFPAITICNQNPINEQYAFSYLKDKFNFYDDFGFYNGHQEDEGSAEDNQYFFSQNYLNVSQLIITLINDLNETELSSMGYDLDSEMLISCQYKGNLCSESKGDFKRFWNNIYGNCHTFYFYSN
jgi:hypothetical protein